MVPVAAMVGMGVSAAIAMLLPVGALIWLITRRAPDGTRRYPQLGRAFVCGMLAFAVSQVLTRLPLMAFLSTVQQPWAAVLVSAPVASFTAGLFEETGRLLIMLWLLKRFHRWVDGVSFGLGHGGLEAILVVGLSSVSNLVLAILISSGQTPAGLSPERIEALKTTLTATSPELFYLAGLERVSAIALHVGLSVLVLWGIVAGRRLLGWALAVLIHGSANLVVVLTAMVAPVLVAEFVLLALVVAFWVLFVWRSRPWFPDGITPDPAAAAPGR